MGAIRTALSSAEFLTGLRWGGLAALGGGLGAVIWRWRLGEAASLVGVLFAVAAAFALPVVRSVPSEMLLGLALLGVGGAIAPFLRISLALQIAVAGPGAWLIVGSLGDSYQGWFRWLLLGAIAGGSALVASSDHRLGLPILGPGLFAISIAGVYLDVPDTEELLVLLGVMGPLALLGWPLGLSRLGWAGSYMAVGTLVWAAAWGGIGRQGSVVGAVACLGVLVLLPFLARGEEKIALARWPTLVAIHLVVVGIASRVAGFRSDPWEAGLMAGAALALGVGLLTMIFPGREPYDEPSQESFDPAAASSGDEGRQ